MVMMDRNSIHSLEAQSSALHELVIVGHAQFFPDNSSSWSLFKLAQRHQRSTNMGKMVISF